MILDQVSYKQGAATFQRVTNTIHRLLEKELYTMADMLLSETASVEALHSRTPLGIKFKPLRESGFSLTTEPFFRGLLLAIHYYTLSRFFGGICSKREILEFLFFYCRSAIV